MIKAEMAVMHLQASTCQRVPGNLQKQRSIKDRFPDRFQREGGHEDTWVSDVSPAELED